MRIRFNVCWSTCLFLLLPVVLIHAQDNLIVNGTFADDSGWNLGQYSEGQATGTVDNGTYTIAISAPGTEVWSIQFTQSGIALDSGAAYAFSFSISSTIERSVEVSLSRDGGAYESYSGRDTLQVSTESFQYEKLFIMELPTDTSVRFELNCGRDTGTIAISNVTLVRYTEQILAVTRPSAGEVLYSGIPYTISWTSINVSGELTIELSGDNGSSWTSVGTANAAEGEYLWVPEARFSPWCRIRLKHAGDGDIAAESDGLFELAPMVNRVKNGVFEDDQHWTIGIYGGTASGAVSDDGMFHIRIDTAAAELWQIQLSQSGVNLIKGQRYHLSFVAYAQAETGMQVNIGMDHEPYSSYIDTAQSMVALTTEPKRYTITFIMQGETDSSARVEFNCGTATSDIFIDEVALFEQYSAPVITIDRVHDRIAPVKADRQIVFGEYTGLSPVGTVVRNRKSAFRVFDLQGRRKGSVQTGLRKARPMAPGLYVVEPVNSRTP